MDAEVPGHPRPCREFEAILGYIQPCFRTNKHQPIQTSRKQTKYQAQQASDLTLQMPALAFIFSSDLFSTPVCYCSSSSPFLNPAFIFQPLCSPSFLHVGAKGSYPPCPRVSVASCVQMSTERLSLFSLNEKGLHRLTFEYLVLD